MNRKRNMLGVSSNSNSEKRDTSLQRSSVQTPARGTSRQPSQAVASRQPSPAMASQQPSPAVASLQPSRVEASQFSRVTFQPSQVLSLQFARMTVPQLCQGNTPQPFEGTLHLSRMVAPQPSRGILQPCHEVAPKPSRGILQPSCVVAPQPSWVTSPSSRVTSQSSWKTTSMDLPPAAPPPTPTPPAHLLCRYLPNSFSRGHPRLQECCFLVGKRKSIAEIDQFCQLRAKMAAEWAGGAEGSRGTAKPLPPIRLPAAAVAGPDTTHARPKKQVVFKNRAPSPGQRNLQGAPQVGTGPLPNSRPCTSQEQQLQPQPPQQPRRSRPTPHRGRSVRNPGAAERPEPEAAVPVTRYTINLSADATSLLLRRHLENKWAPARLLPGSQIRAGLDLTSLMKVSLLNNQNRYDDEEYEEDPAPGVVDQELVHKCTEWLHGVEEAKRKHKLRTLPHLYDP